MLLGHVGKKEKKVLKNGGEMVVLSVATNKKYKDGTGQPQELTTWHNVFCFSKLADIAERYVHVGDMLWVQGEIQNKKIESGERAGQYAYSIHANDLKFIPKGNKAQDTHKPTQKKQSLSEFDDDDNFSF